MSILAANGRETKNENKYKDIILIMLNEMLGSFKEHLIQKKKLKKKIITFLILGIMIAVGTFMYGASDAYDSDIEPFLYFLLFGVSPIFLILSLVSWRKSRNLIFSNSIESIQFSTLDYGLYPFEDGSVLIDEEMVTKNEELNFTQLKDLNELAKLQKDYEESLINLPLLLPKSDQSSLNQSSSEVKILEKLKSIKMLYEEAENMSFEMGLYERDHPITEYLLKHNPYTTSSDDEVQIKENEKKLNRIMGVKSLKEADKSKDVDIISSKFIKTFENDMKKLSQIRKESFSNFFDKRTEHLRSVMHMRAHSFYCPECNKEIIEDIKNRSYNMLENKSHAPVSFNNNSKMKVVDWENGLWQCPLCSVETKHPIPVHKFYDECFLPAFNLLMLENEKDRLKIYTQLRDKMVDSYQNYEKEKSHIVREHRGNIAEQRYRLRSLRTEVEKKGKMIQSIQIMLEKFEQKKIEELEMVEKRREEIQNQLIKEARQIENRVNKETSKLISKIESDMSKFAKKAAKSEAKRDRYLQTITAVSAAGAFYQKETYELIKK